MREYRIYEVGNPYGYIYSFTGNAIVYILNMHIVIYDRIYIYYSM